MILTPEDFLKKIAENADDYTRVIRYIKNNAFHITNDINFMHRVIANGHVIYAVTDLDIEDITVTSEALQIAMNQKDYYFTPIFKLIKLIAD